MDSVTFGDYLRGLRKNKGLTLRGLADDSKVSQSYITNVENGKRGVPSPEILKKLAEPLGVEYEALMIKAGYWSQNFSDDNKMLFEQISNKRSKVLELIFDILKILADDDGIYPDELHRELFDILGGWLSSTLSGKVDFDEWYLYDYLNKTEDELSNSDHQYAIEEFNKYYNYTNLKYGFSKFDSYKKYTEEFLEELIALADKYELLTETAKPRISEIDLHEVLTDNSIIIRFNQKLLTSHQKSRLQGFLEALEIMSEPGKDRQ